MADHRIRLTDREQVLAKCASRALTWALLPIDPNASEEYRRLGDRLEHTKAGGMPAATRKARKHFKLEASGK